MVDNDKNSDEYQFVELDALDNETLGSMDSNEDADSPSFINKNSSQPADVKRNAIIVVIFVIVTVLMYKLIGGIFFSSEATNQSIKQTNTMQAQVVAPKIENPNPVIATQPIQPVETIPVVNNEHNTELVKKVSAVEASQESVRSEFNAVSQKVSGVNDNLNNLNAQINNLNQAITNLSNQVLKQSEEINVLMARAQPKKRVKPISHSTVSEPLAYYIQAVIPGRAWLIGTNGSTLTVSEGTKISGYGMVTLIDSMQGRVLTSSGQVIKFSQEDS